MSESSEGATVTQEYVTSADKNRALVFKDIKIRATEASQSRSTITSTAVAGRVLADFPPAKPDYSIEAARTERPLTHYSRAGNILQVLRFGIQSNNFKSRLNKLRVGNPDANRIARQMCGLRIRQGGSYQGKDSISLSRYDEQLFAGPGNVLFLVNPNIPVFGNDPTERQATGYGYGIKVQTIDGYEIGNPTAYSTEVVAGN